MTVATEAPASVRAPGVSSAITSEFTKFISLPSQRALIWISVAVAGFMALVFYLSLPVTQGRDLGRLAPGEILGAGILGVDAAAFVAIVLSAMFVGAEYSTGMIESTIILTPSRGRLVAAKIATVGGASTVIGILSAAVCVLAAIITGAMVNMDAATILNPAGVQLAAGSIVMPVIYSVIAASAAFVFRSTALGILVPLVVMAIGGIAGWFGATISAVVTPLLPVAAIHTLSGVAEGNEAIGALGAVVSVLTWAGVSIAAAAWRLHRRDV